MKRICLALLICAALMLALLPAGALAASDARITDFDAYIEVAEDGSLNICEVIAYYVTDTINGFTRDIDEGQGHRARHEDFSVALLDDNGNEMPLSYDANARKGDDMVYEGGYTDNGLYRYRVYLPSRRGDTLTVVYRYTLPEMCEKLTDAGMLKFLLLGDAWELRIENYTAHISFAAASEVCDARLTHAHADVGAYSNGELTVSARDVGRGGKLGVRLLFDAESIPAMRTTLDKSAADVMAEEEAFEREKAQAQTTSAAAGGIGAALAAAIIAITRRKWGSDEPNTLPEYRIGDPLPDRSDVTPAMAGYAVNGAVGSAQLSATMLDLVRRGYLIMEVPDDFDGRRGIKQACYVRTDKPADDLMDHERFALDWILGIGGGMSVSLKQIERESSHGRYGNMLERWARSVKEASSGVFAKRTSGQRTLGFAALGMIALLIALCIYMVKAGTASGGTAAIMFFVGVLLLGAGIYAFCARRRSKLGLELAQPWQRFADWVRRGVWNATDIPYDREYWEKVMVYALALGMDTKLAKRLEAFGPGFGDTMRGADRAMRDRHYNDMYIYYGAYTSYSRSSFSHSSSSSGGGGGSGSGGGGGGGTF